MLKELRTFVAVGRHGSFSRAGQHVGLTQSAVSGQIQRLEAALGLRLFDRVGRSARLNDAGRATLARADALVALFEGLHLPPAAPAALRLGAVASVQLAGLPDALVVLAQREPQLRVRVVPGVSLALLGQVDAGELDAAVMVRPPYALPPELTWRPLWSEPFVLAVPAALPGRAWARLLRDQPFLRYDRASFGGRVVARFLDEAGLQVDDRVEMDELGGLVQLVARGFGVAIVPQCPPVVPLLPGVRLLGLGRHAPRREIGLVERRRHPQVALVAALFDALRGTRPAAPLRAAAAR